MKRLFIILALAIVGCASIPSNQSKIEIARLNMLDYKINYYRTLVKAGDLRPDEGFILIQNEIIVMKQEINTENIK